MMIKKLILLSLMLVAFKAQALPQYAETKTYYTDSSYTTVAGQYISGCTVGSVHFEGTQTAYVEVDPDKHDCGTVGQIPFSYEITQCFGTYTYVTTDEDDDGYVDGWQDLHECVLDEWFWPFD